MEEMVIRKHQFIVDFQKDIFKAENQITMVQDDNKTNIFVFNFIDEINELNNVVIRVKHYSGTILEFPLEIQDKKAELIVTNDITAEPGEIKLSIVLVGSDDKVLSITDNQENVIVKEKLIGSTPAEYEQSVLMDLVSKNSKLKQERDKLQQDKNLLLQDKYNLESDKIILIQEKEDLQLQYDDLLQEKNTIEAERNTLTEQKENLEIEKENLIQEKEDLEIQNETLNQEKSELEAENSTLTEAKENLESDIDYIGQMLDEINGEVV